jgi:hypothetical protein
MFKGEFEIWQTIKATRPIRAETRVEAREAIRVDEVITWNAWMTSSNWEKVGKMIWMLGKDKFYP